MISLFGKGQESTNDTLVVEGIYYNGELIPAKELSPITIVAVLTEEQKRRRAEYNRLRVAVYTTYPYARTAGVLLNDINGKISAIDNRKDRKRYLKTREEEIKREFKKPITNLSVYQGKVLMKLVNRETGNSCFEIIKEYRGGFVAGAYQTVAWLFHTSLKQPYDPVGEDAVIERLVKEVQSVYGYPEIAKNLN